MKKYEIAVVGGGMVGAAIAIGFAKQGRTVVVIENKQPVHYDEGQPRDIRVSAISHASVSLLERLGGWKHTVSMRVCPYRRLETWEHPECRTRFHSDSLGLNELGYIVENRLIQLGLWQEFDQYSNLELRCPEKVETMALGSTNQITLQSGETIEASWVIGADGANSQVRQFAGIGITAWDYRQHCMLINVETEKDQQDITWQQFFPSGPRSFLPLGGHHASLVWYDTPKRIRQLQAMDEGALRKEILTHFPQELGDITVTDKGAFPLTRRHAQQYVKNRCVLLGDAAHTINPLAGQGVNLGFKDVVSLLDETDGKELNLENLSRYESTRRQDNLVMQTGMDVFYKGFRSSNPLIKFVRNGVLKIADNSGRLKDEVLKYAVGLK
ncbi:2-octaprenyl-3-methyl-6-methoxy-1,4-benzoquinol hydroxylase [Vibrio sp. 10N.261.55.A7]|uniref:2-octaprenyl-3-methyl-6-methoxy-1,4-benzoquinol hydroxylase n=1 Tax=Vibrio sp. 10N.261.55.A7 TaxID=1880851 RepID=UPI000C8571A9|nr:2-octaprenyl-3-methyl-6-methoxy-1,4-benzoquinol hydroxylase [Vibrio sp. 10N.261.55.A7]PMJ90463.1 2-octaprenyl-3-methyl-6-methoxy-1,4-benzoquinol hydroxylase [Vibrio sp. 10N.261.55.A7]